MSTGSTLSSALGAVTSMIVLSGNALADASGSVDVATGPRLASTAAAGDGVADAPPRDQLEEVVVTATKRAERAQDVPMSLSAVSAADIDQRGFSEFGNFLNTQPGVYFEDGGPGHSVIHIRGVQESGTGSTVATYFGEALTSMFTERGGRPNLRFVDIDRVEVLRGPQGTLFGADALAGVVRIIPAAPDLDKASVEAAARGFTTAHSDEGSYHVEGVANIPLLQGRLALRLVGYKDDIAGYIDNVVPAAPALDYSAALGVPPGTLVNPAISAFTHKDVNREDTWGTRAALRWQATDALRADLTFVLQDEQLNGEPFALPASGPYTQLRALDAFEPGAFGERIHLTTLQLTYDWRAASLTAISNWGKLSRFDRRDISFIAGAAPPAGFGIALPWALHDWSSVDAFTEEVRLQSRGEQALQWTLGAFYLKQDTDSAQLAPDFSCPQCLSFVELGQNFVLSVPDTSVEHERQRAVFGEVSYDFLPRWTVGAGGRYLRESVSTTPQSPQGLLFANVPAQEPGGGSVSQFNPSSYVRFKPSRDVTFYAQAARGFRSAAANPTLPDSCQQDATQAGYRSVSAPDSLWNYELGVKSRLAGGRLGIDAAVYRTKWKGVQLQTNFRCGLGGTINAGDVTGKGAELALQAQASAAWSFNMSLAYNKNTFDDVQPGLGLAAGERMPGAPQENASIGAQYTFALGGAWQGFARADYVYVGDVQLRYLPATLIKEGGFGEGNVRVGLQRDALSVEIFGNNLTDRRGVAETEDPSFGERQVLVRPRELGVELRYVFR